MNWFQDSTYRNVYYSTKYFGKYKYRVEVTIETIEGSSIRLWYSTSSGKKRKELEIYEDKENKSLGGLQALFWIREAILDFPRFLNQEYRTKDLNLYLCVDWEDSRRRKIYERGLKPYGFYYMPIDGNKTLIKLVDQTKFKE